VIVTPSTASEYHKWDASTRVLAILIEPGQLEIFVSSIWSWVRSITLCFEKIWVLPGLGGCFFWKKRNFGVTVLCHACKIQLMAQFLMKTERRIPRTRELLHTPWQPLGIPFAITPLSYLYQSLPSPIPGDRARGKRSVAPEPPRTTLYQPQSTGMLTQKFAENIFCSFFSGLSRCVQKMKKEKRIRIDPTQLILFRQN